MSMEQAAQAVIAEGCHPASARIYAEAAIRAYLLAVIEREKERIKRGGLVRLRSPHNLLDEINRGETCDQSNDPRP